MTMMMSHTGTMTTSTSVDSLNDNDARLRDARYVTVSHHMQNAFGVMYELRQRQELCDITLRVGEDDFHAHKVVLAGCSPYLRAMFTNGMMETEKSVITLHGVDGPTMDLLLEFMYKGCLEISIDNVQGLLQAASMLNMANLRNACSQFLQSQLDASNCLGIQSFADIYSCLELESAARQFVEQRFLEVVRCEEFFQLSAERIIDLIKNERIQIEKEDQIFEAICSWVQYDPYHRTDQVCCVLPHVKLALLDRDYLEDVVVRTNFIRSCCKCQAIVSLAIRMKLDNNALASIRTRAQPQCIFVVGGRTSVDSQLKSMERYDVWRDQWIPMGSMSTARTAVGAVTMNGYLYAVGGECAVQDSHEDTLYLRSVERYDPIIKQWSPCSDMKISRSFIALTSLGGQLYAIGGENRMCSFDIVERYCPKQDSWTFVQSLKKKRAGCGACVCEGKIYVAGGYDKTYHTDRASVEVFNPEVGEWTFIAEMSKARSGLVLTAIDHYIYATGGRFRHTDRYYDVAERYNTITAQWTTLSPMSTPRAWPAAAVFDGRIFVLGGFDGFNRLRSAEVYDPESDQWSYVSNMNISRAGCAAAVV